MARTPMSEAQKENLRQKAREREAAKKAQRALEPPVERMPAIPDDDGVAVEEVDLGHVNGLTPFELFLQTLDAETRELVGEAELQAIFTAQEVKARQERRDKLKKTATERALHHARVGAGLLSDTAVEHSAWQERMNRKVKWTIDLPDSADIGLRVDGVIYLHGHEYTGTMAQYLSFREIEYRSKQAELDFEGRGRLHHLRKNAGFLNARLA